MLELAEWLSKQTYIIDADDQIKAVREVLDDLQEEIQRQLLSGSKEGLSI